MDKKTLVIIILSLVTVGLLIWIFGGIRPDYRAVENRLESSIIRVDSITQSARFIQAGYKELEFEFEKERTIRDGLQKSSEYFEQKYKESQSYNREQREIIDRLTSRDIESDKSITRIEDRINRIKGNVERLEEIGNENTTPE